ncbi:MAG TPA: hypothetical protein VLA52_01775 [Thermohalobaculum sp.]|nr:hypothetical protein [Thermohalobaculum sp.]
MKRKPYLLMAAMGLAAACAAPNLGADSARARLGEALHSQKMLVPERPPVIAAILPEDVALAQLTAARIDAERLYRNPLSQWAGVDALPFLTSTDAGRRFLAATPPRALARGAPEESCPALAMASGASGEAAIGRATVVAAALSQCLAQLPPDSAICGCRVVALDSIVTVPRDQIVYATGTSARLRAAALGIDLLLVAEDGPDGETLLRDLSGPVAWLTRGVDNAVTLRLAGGGRVFEGSSIPVGYRRGRLAERIYATDAAGVRMSLLIGFGPDELAQSAGAWLAWPQGG